MVMKKVLIVDDSDLIHRMLEMVILSDRAHGCEILHAKNGQEALGVLDNNTDVELILLDINMPIMNGLEFLCHRRENKVHEQIPVIIVSTEGKEEDTIRGLEAGASAYIKKPFQPSDLKSIIQKVIAVN